jgi:hypothetical protein
MRRRYQTARLQRIDEILQKTLKKHHIPLKTGDRQLQEFWSQAVGPRISAQTQADSIKRDSLFVKVANSAWMQQLHFLKQDILDKFNQLRSKDPVRNIYFAIGEIPSAAKAEKGQIDPPVGLPPLKTRDRKMIDKSLAAVADEELREILRRAMTKEIIRRRFMEKEKAP